MGAPVGNRNAAGAKLFQQALKRALARKAGSVDAGLDKVCDVIVRKAIDDGDKPTADMIADRIDGKPAQMMIMQGDEDGGPIQIAAIERRIIDANPDA